MYLRKNQLQTNIAEQSMISNVSDKVVWPFQKQQRLTWAGIFIETTKPPSLRTDRGVDQTSRTYVTSNSLCVQHEVIWCRQKAPRKRNTARNSQKLHTATRWFVQGNRLRGVSKSWNYAFRCKRTKQKSALPHAVCERSRYTGRATRLLLPHHTYRRMGLQPLSLYQTTQTKTWLGCTEETDIVTTIPYRHYSWKDQKM